MSVPSRVGESAESNGLVRQAQRGAIAMTRPMVTDAEAAAWLSDSGYLHDGEIVLSVEDQRERFQRLLRDRDRWIALAEELLVLAIRGHDRSDDKALLPKGHGVTNCRLCRRVDETWKLLKEAHDA